MRGYFFYRYRLSRKKSALLLFFLVSALLAIALLTATFQLRPILSSMATARVSNTVTRVVTEAVNQTIDSGEIDYSDLVSFEKDNEGKVTAVKSNMAEFNRLQSKILDRVLEKLSEVSTKELSIPLGSLTGSALLSGRGPLITVKMQSVGSSSASLENVFTSAGINQTRHQIQLNVDVVASILMPGFSTATKVSNSFVVAETVIVGSVPESYTYFNSDAPIDEDAREFILNGN
ncbi:sporulation protein YunB [Oscillibacter hominis]|uniref:Sporulation protein YunB n=1 Tax=Oscillibacter hominis TaxID=2763056 RepID=A0A7G9B7P1_9FIRM|nr:sporulation protein YunB [Oscillibacter hominis]QNL45572.1 sporulation protein YunB [Oscillibacter hominis]